MKRLSLGLLALLFSAGAAAADELKWPATGTVTQDSYSKDHYDDANQTPKWPSLGHVYSSRPEHRHWGVDVAVWADSNGNKFIYAAGAGKVTVTGDANNSVSLDHGGGLVTRYLHMSKLYVTNGQNVNTGQLLGREGAVGYVTGAHLYFEVRINGSYQHMTVGSTVTKGDAISPTFSYGATSPPPAPVIVAPSAGASLPPGNVTLDWNPVSGVDYYLVELYKSGSLYKSAWPTSTSQTFSLPAGSYTWAVWGHNSMGYGAGASSSFIVASISPPPAPVITAPSAGATLGPGTVTLDWSSVSGADYYYLELFKSNSLYKQAWPSSSSKSFSLPAGSYAWIVWAHNAAGYGAGASSSFTVVSLTPPPAPVIYAPSAGAILGPGTVTLDWSTVSGADYYYVELHLNGSLYKKAWPSSSSASFSLSAGSYTWAVWAHNAAGYGAKASSSFSVGSQLPGKPVGLAPDGWKWVSTTSVPLDWSSVSGASEFEVYLLFWTGSGWSYYGTFATSSSKLALWPIVHYRYFAWKVRAKSSAGSGPWSSWAYFYYNK